MLNCDHMLNVYFYHQKAEMLTDSVCEHWLYCMLMGEKHTGNFVSFSQPDKNLQSIDLC